MSTTFEFKPDESVAMTDYEFVNIIPGTPKNPTDFHDLENILRHRMVMLIKELYGNCRTSPSTIGNGFSIVTINTKKYIQVNGLWYIDGYRIHLNNLISTTEITEGQNYSIWLALKFEEITYTSDPDIAMTDPGTGQIIATSSRIQFAPKIVTQLSSTQTDPTITGYDYIYHIVNMTWNTQSSTYEYADANGFVYINIKYNEAIEIAQHAVHTEADEETVMIKRLVTGLTDEQNNDKAKAYIQEISEDKVRMGLMDENGTTFGAFEMVYDQGQWQPILWLRPAVSEYPVTFMTPDGVKMFDNKGNSAEIDNHSLRLGNKDNYFIADTTEVLSFMDRKVALWIKKAQSDLTTGIATITSTSGTDYNTNTVYYSNGKKLESDVLNAGSPKTAIYTFDLGTSTMPTDGLVKIRHQLLFGNPEKSGAIVSCKIEVSSNNSTWVTLFIEKWLLRSTNLQNTTPFEFSARDNTGTVNRYLRATYTILPLNYNETDNAPNVWGAVALYTNMELIWEVYTNSYPVAEITNLVVNNYDPASGELTSCHILWIDPDGNLRIKKANNDRSATLGVAIEELVDPSNTPGNNVTDLGGKLVGGFDFENVEIIVDSNPELYAKPTYEANTSKFVFPIVNTTLSGDGKVDGGLISSAQYKALVDAAFGETVNTNIYANANIVYVAPTWHGDTETPFFTGLQAAVTHLNNNGGGTAIVYPGVYNEIVDMASAGPTDIGVNIVAFDPFNTIVKGIKCTSASINRVSYINIGIYANTSSPAVEIKGNVNNRFIFGDKCRIASGTDNSLVDIEKGWVDFHGTMIHASSADSVSSIMIGKDSTDGNAPTVTFKGDMYFERLGPNNKGIISLYGGNVIFDCNITSAKTTTTSSSYLIGTLDTTTFVNATFNGLIKTPGGQQILYHNGAKKVVTFNNDIHVTNTNTYSPILFNINQNDNGNPSNYLRINSNIMVNGSTAVNCISITEGICIIKCATIQVELVNQGIICIAESNQLYVYDSQLLGGNYVNGVLGVIGTKQAVYGSASQLFLAQHSSHNFTNQVARNINSADLIIDGGFLSADLNFQLMRVA